MSKYIIENKVVGMLDGEDNFEFVQNDGDVKNLWIGSIIDESGKFGFIDDLVLFVGDSEEEVKCEVIEFLQKEINVE